MPNLITTDISTSVSVVAIAGQVVFSFPFPIFAADDIKVDIDGSPITTFSVAGVGSSSGGTIALATEALAGDVVTIQRDVPVKRSIDLPATGPVNMEDVDAEFDRFFAIAQQLKTGLARALQVVESEDPLSFPTLVERAGMILSFDALGAIDLYNPTALVGSAGAAATVAIGGVTTLAPGAAATVVNVGTTSAAVLNFAIPQGDGAGFTTEQIQDIVAAMMSAGSGMAIGYDDAAGLLSFASTTTVPAGSITLPQLANLATATFIGRSTAGTGVPEALSATLATALLNVATPTLKGLVPPPGAGMSHAFLRGDVTWAGVEVPLVAAVSDETTALTAGVGKITFRAPFACDVVRVRASLTIAQVSGLLLTVDVNRSGATILSTKLTIDNAERTSVTAVTAPILSGAAFTDDEEISIDIDQVGDGTAKGLKVMLLLRRTA